MSSADILLSSAGCGLHFSYQAVTDAAKPPTARNASFFENNQRDEPVLNT